MTIFFGIFVNKIALIGIKSLLPFTLPCRDLAINGFGACFLSLECCRLLVHFKSRFMLSPGIYLYSHNIAAVIKDHSVVAYQPVSPIIRAA